LGVSQNIEAWKGTIYQRINYQRKKRGPDTSKQKVNPFISGRGEVMGAKVTLKRTYWLPAINPLKRGTLVDKRFYQEGRGEKTSGS